MLRTRSGDEVYLLPSHRGWALVDVETSGLNASRDRVLSVAAIAVDRNGQTEAEYSSFFNPGCDPGPVHIHGLTPERLRGAPTFDSAVVQLHELLSGRTLVAHNANFDHGFLVGEAKRAGVTLPITHRLCTVTLTRRLQLDVPNAQLATLARHWQIPQRDAHNAVDDVRVLLEVFRRSLDLANNLGLQVPVVACGSTTRAYPDNVTRVPCPWTDPGRFDAGVGLVQGTKVVITGSTSLPRLELARRFTDAGLDVMNGVSGKTGLLIANTGVPDSRKLRVARDKGIPIVDEATAMRLVERVVPGTPKSVPVIEVLPQTASSRPSKQPVALPWSGRRVLVLGGDHTEAAAIRSRLTTLGATPAINFTAGVTHVLVLDGGHSDPRIRKAHDRQLPILESHHLETLAGDTPIGEPESAVATAAATRAQTPRNLTPGAVMDVPSDVTEFTVNVAWADTAAPIEVDVVAFELDRDHKVLSDDEFVFYNQPASPDGAVRLCIDGDREQGIAVDLSAVDVDIDRIMVGASIETATFGDVGALSVTVDSSELTFATAVLDAATTERSMIIAEIYRRNDVWRIRALGQGYDDSLAEFAVRHGVEVDD
ncbi:TerD family protein [Gordonia sp. GONU]|uniref:TerD family protein n=1 Tax=Gordonia sp. GONU TaxID=2972949 RepID=UPI0021ACF299|nr:TerD family protein [Gordonia sp. GONU]MCR8897189.1 TerD family protein [Gordonia sp. GONU]